MTVRFPWKTPSLGRQRLSAVLREVETTLDRCTPASGAAAGTAAWHAESSSRLRAAKDAFDRHEDDTAWELVKAASRSLVPLMDTDERRARAVAVRAQVGKVQSAWRKGAIRNLVGRSPRVPSSAELMEALFHLDTDDANGLRRTRVRADELGWTAGILAGAALGVVAVVYGGHADLETVTFRNVRLVLLVQLFGIIGACISATERTTRRPTMRVPDERAAKFATLVRPLTGAAAGLVALAGAQAGVTTAASGAVLLGAFAAGFSERVVLRFVPRDDGSGTDEAPPTPAVGAGEPSPPAEPRPGEYFRAGAGVVLTDGHGRVLVFERSDGRGRWQLPQGGIETGEAPIDAAYRELEEETGLRREDVEVRQELPEWLVYELPSELRSEKTGRGQVQRWFDFRVRDPDVEPTLVGTRGVPAEFTGWKWIALADLADQAVGFRKDVYRRIAELLA